ncbi:hypothetical protein Emag_003707 [Eimeria magna]
MVRFLPSLLLAAVGVVRVARAADFQPPPATALTEPEPELGPRIIFQLETLAYPLFLAKDEEERAGY